MWISIVVAMRDKRKKNIAQQLTFIFKVACVLLFLLHFVYKVNLGIKKNKSLVISPLKCTYLSKLEDCLFQTCASSSGERK